MPNLNESLGLDYIRQMCVGAIFQIDNEVHMLRDVDENTYHTKSIDLATNRLRWKSTKLPFDKLTSMANFSYPKLGYRMLHSPDQGPIVFTLTNRRSAHRGLRIEQLAVEYLNVYPNVLPEFFEAWHIIGSEQKIQTIFRPEFYSFAEGIKKLLNGEAIAFAVNEDIAVTLAFSDNQGKAADILFKGKVVGSVAEDGTIALSNKIMNRDSLRRKFER